MRDYGAYAPSLLVHGKDQILTVTLNNPEAMNASTPQMHTALTRIWDDVHEDDDVHVVVLTGAGRAFSAGGNLGSMQQMIDDPELWWPTATEAKRIVYRMLECDKPIIARLNGHAIGLGSTLAVCCDIIVADERAKIGDPHVGVGLVAGDGGAVLWPQRIGFARAKEYLLTGELLSARRAEEIGLINYAVPASELDAKVQELAEKLARAPARALRWTKQLVNLPLRQLAHSMMDLGLATETLSQRGADHREAVRAFLAKEPPRFRGK
jgi:enoyl-CoA hydratase